MFNGVSKSYAMTGWRIGYAAANAEIAKAMSTYLSQSTGSPCSISQQAALAAFAESQEPSFEMKKAFDERRKYFVERVKNIPGVSCLEPDGAFYIFVNIAGTGMDSDGFCRTMIDEAGVSMTPGHVFGTMGDGFVRVSYANSMENLQRAVILMREVLEKRAAR